MNILLSEILIFLELAQKNNNIDQASLPSLLLKHFISKMVSDNHFIIIPKNSNSDNEIVIGKNEDEESIFIEVDIPLVIRPRHTHLNTNLSDLKDTELFNAITLNTFQPEPINGGAQKKIFISAAQCHYNSTDNIFDCKGKETKILGLNAAPKPSVNFIISQGKQNYIRTLLAKKPNNRGVYFPCNDDNYPAGMVSSYIDGENLDVYLMQAKDSMESGEHTLEEYEFQFKQIIINLFKELAILHHKGLIHRDIKLGNIMITEKSNEEENLSEATVHLIDFDISVFNDEKIAEVHGTPVFLPSLAYQQCLNHEIATPYQDIYGALVCSVLLFSAELHNFLTYIEDPLIEALEKNIENYYSYLNSIQQYCIYILTNTNSSFLKENILPGLQDTSITSFAILANMIKTDSDLAEYVATKIVSYSSNDNKVLDNYMQYYRENRLSNNERKNFSIYLAECFIGVECFSLKEVQRRVKLADDVIEKELEVEEIKDENASIKSTSKSIQTLFFCKDELSLEKETAKIDQGLRMKNF